MSLRSPGRETANLGGAKIKTTAHGAHPTGGLLLPELGQISNTSVSSKAGAGTPEFQAWPAPWSCAGQALKLP